MSLRVGMVAGEPSGDLLAARVLHGLRAHVSDLVCEGIGGSHMQAQGLQLRHAMHALSVFGYVDALKRLPALWRIYRDVRHHWCKQRPDVFVGVDAPDFNLRLEQHLRAVGIPTVHFVGPSIWAWRYERIHAIRQAVSHILVLFPFETELYRREGIPVTYVGHPLASQIPMQTDAVQARLELGLDQTQRVLALLPGSRASEIALLAPRFLQAVQQLQRQDPDLAVVVPVVNAQRHAQFQQVFQRFPVKNIRVFAQSVQPDRPVAWDVLQAADAVLVASGTATLEAMLFKKPMVISYVLSPWMRRLMAWKSGQQSPSVPWVGLPNVLAQEFVVPELLQEAATPQALAESCWSALTDGGQRSRIQARFATLHAQLACDTPTLAARVILQTAQGS